jgi:hypothetical protein
VSLSEFVLTFFNLPLFTARVPLPLLIIADIYGAGPYATVHYCQTLVIVSINDIYGAGPFATAHHCQTLVFVSINDS